MLHNPWPEVITRLRRARGRTQEQTAEAADTAANTWSRWEQPGFRPSDKQLEKILLGLGCTADELGTALSLAMAGRYLQQSDDDRDDEAGGEAGGEARDDPQPAVEVVPVPDPFYSNLLGDRLTAWEAPESAADLVGTAVDKSFAVLISTTQILAELQRHWPRLEAEASDEDRRHVVLLRGYLHELLDLCLTLSEELQEIVAPKT